MTIPVERTRAVLCTKDFLFALLNPKATPRVPREVRRQASRCLRHYPGRYEIADLARTSPNFWGPIDGI